MIITEEALMNDSRHVLVDEKFDDKEELHRFNNRAGVPYSAIYFRMNDGSAMECTSCEREYEQDMVDYYRKSWMQYHLNGEFV